MSDLKQRIKEWLGGLEVSVACHELPVTKLFTIMRDEINGSVEQIEQLQAQVKQLEQQKQWVDDLTKAVAHIGIDWGYGEYELESHFIDEARKRYEANEELQNPTLTPPTEGE